MTKFGQPKKSWIAPVAVFLALLTAPPHPAGAEQLFQLRNGMVVRGFKIEIPSLKEGFGAAAAAQNGLVPIWRIDDGLRRIYVHGRGMVAAEPVDVGNLGESIELWQPKPLGGKNIGGLGNIYGVSPFNSVGRRLLSIRGPEGPVQVVQGIAELTPRYAKLLALKGKPNLQWDMRVATAALESQTLKTILLGRGDDLNTRIEAIRFFTAAKRYGVAKELLLKTLKDFPEEQDLAKQVVALTVLQAEQLLDEAKFRDEVGQHRYAAQILNNFPLQGVGPAKRIEVENAIEQMSRVDRRIIAIVDRLETQLDELGPPHVDNLRPIVDEIKLDLSEDTLARLSDYERLGDANTLGLDSRVSLAITGWLMGAGSGELNINIATSLVRVRDLVVEYLGDSTAARRKAILDELSTLEGAEARSIDRMLPLIRPALDFSEESVNGSIEGLYHVETDRFQYDIQLPPEYNPLRSYPCVLALPESRSDPITQIDWWAGLYDSRSGTRLGHATRNGFIVVSPVWGRPSQRLYEYTAAEHDRVLASLRHAMRRASIDSDRVFIAGHGEGATAAWDMALAHPDTWAGLIAISGAPGKTVPHYEPNSEYLPIYAVMGELDGNRADGAIINDYMSFKHDAMIVMYRGRGREYFYDEIKELFTWMRASSHVRRPIPVDIEARTMRSGDQFFWWIELKQLKPDVDLDPILWKYEKRKRAGEVSGSIGKDNQIRLRGPSDQFTVCLRPQPEIDMAEEVIVRYKTRRIARLFDGNPATLLEDVRTRADRRRGIWMRIDVP